MNVSKTAQKEVETIQCLALSQKRLDQQIAPGCSPFYPLPRVQPKLFGPLTLGWFQIGTGEKTVLTTRLIGVLGVGLDDISPSETQRPMFQLTRLSLCLVF